MWGLSSPKNRIVVERNDELKCTPVRSGRPNVDRLSLLHRIGAVRRDVARYRGVRALVGPWERRWQVAGLPRCRAAALIAVRTWRSPPASGRQAGRRQEAGSLSAEPESLSVSLHLLHSSPSPFPSSSSSPPCPCSSLAFRSVLLSTVRQRRTVRMLVLREARDARGRERSAFQGGAGQSAAHLRTELNHDGAAAPSCLPELAELGRAKPRRLDSTRLAATPLHSAPLHSATLRYALAPTCCFASSRSLHTIRGVQVSIRRSSARSVPLAG